MTATLLLVPLLLATAFSDLRRMRIPNVIPYAMVLVFLATLSWTLPLDETLTRAGIALAALVLGIAAFSVGLIGGGDVKSLSALLLFVPVTALSQFMLIFAGALILGIIGLGLARKAFGHPASSWVSMQSAKRFPMGVSIAMAGLALPVI